MFIRIQKFLIFFLSGGALAASIDMPIPTSLVEFSPESMQSVIFERNVLPRVELVGVVHEGAKLFINSSFIKLNQKRQFKYPIPLTEEPTSIRLTVIPLTEEALHFRLSCQWKKHPTFVRAKIMDGSTVIRKTTEMVGSFPSLEWVAFQWAQEKSRESIAHPWYAHAQLGMLFVLPSTGGNSLSPEVAWIPQFGISRHFSVRAILGTAPIKYDSETIFFGFRAGILSSMRVRSWAIELGAEGHWWGNYGGTRPAVTLALRFNEVGRISKLMESFFVNYAHQFAESSQIHVLGLGLGFKF